MSIKIKLPLLVLVACIINILIFYGYYNLSLSKEISKYNINTQEKLQNEVNAIIKEIDNKQDFKKILGNISQTKNLIIRVNDQSDKMFFYAGNETGVNTQVSAAGLFKVNNRIYLLKVTQPLSLKNISSYDMVWDMFKTEVLILFLILLFIGIIIYFNYVKPIINLQKSMDGYKKGIHPRKITRKDEIGLLQNRFVKLTEAIEKEKQKQNLIIASISHDIKTPLTSIMGFAERLKKNNLQEEKYEQYIDIVYNKSVSINNIIEEFDEYLNLHMQTGLRQQKISVEKFCAILKSDYEEELTERGVNFSIKNNCPNEVLFLDISKVRRVFGNIISNSLKHFSLKEPSITVFCFKEEDLVVFSVEDNGTGISDDKMEKIFDPFFTSDKGRSVAGLGLSICKEIIEVSNGKIWAENNESGGLSIKISLPV